MGKLTAETRKKLIDALLALPGIDRQGARDHLLLDLPPRLRATIPRDAVLIVDLNNMLSAAETWNDKDLAQLLDNAVGIALGSQAERELSALRQELGLGGSQRNVIKPPYRAPVPPEPWFDRPEYLTIRNTVLGEESSIFTTLEGRAGLGKTTVAARLAWDEVVRKHFSDGVIWVSLGQQPDIAGELAKIAAYFNVDVSSYVNIDERAIAVQNLLVGRRCLLIVDDAWDAESAEILRDLNPMVALLTTRDRSVARRFAPPRKANTLEQISLEASVALLRDLAPAASNSSELRRVAAAAAGLPLTLHLLARLLDDEATMGWGLDEFLTQVESSTWRGKQLEAIIAKSLDVLPDVERHGFVQLAVFGAQPADFDPLAATAVWDIDLAEARERLRHLVSRHLVDPIGSGRLTLHQSLADVAANKLPANDPVLSRHATYYLDFINHNREDWSAIAVELPQIRRAWNNVTDSPILILGFVEGMYFFQGRQGLWHEELDWMERGLAAARMLGRPSDEVSLLNKLGWVHNRLDGPQCALPYYEQALALAKMLSDQTQQASALNGIGLVHESLGERQKALTYWEQALLLEEAVNDLKGQGVTLALMGRLYFDIGEINQAVEHLERALPLSQAANDQVRQGRTLTSIGMCYRKMGQLSLALEYCNKALKFSEALGDQVGQRYIFHVLGQVYADLGDTQKALGCYEHALRLGEALGDRANQSTTFYRLGLFYYKERNLVEAERMIVQAVMLREATAHPDLQAARDFLMRIRSKLNVSSENIEENNNDPTNPQPPTPNPR